MNPPPPVVFDTEFPTCREGVFVPPGFATPEEIAGVVKLCEDLGYHAVWGTDFVTPTPGYGVPEGERPDWYEPLATIAFCAARTDRIKLGTGVLLAPLREPVILAKQAATIDRLSNGRLLLGLGLGMCRDEFEALMPNRRGAHRGRMLDECLELLRRLLDEEEAVTFSGEYHAVDEVKLYPKPLQRPLPMYVPCRRATAYERIARWGLGITAPAAILPGHLQALAPYLERHGRALSDIDAIGEGEVLLGATREEAVARYRRSRHGQFRLKRQDLASFLEQNWVGTPSEVIDKIGAQMDLGIRHFTILHVPCDTLAERRELLQRFAEEVVPALT